MELRGSEIGGTTDVALAGAGGMIVAKGINDQAGYYNPYNAANDSVERLERSRRRYDERGLRDQRSTTAARRRSRSGYYIFAKGINDNGIYFKSNRAARSAGDRRRRRR